jgi:hypothetical protein
MLQSASQFRPPAPPDFTKDMKELKDFKSTFQSRSLAFFWANSGPDYYNNLVSRKLFEYHLMDDAPAAARIYAVLNLAFHEMTIAIMDAKYAYWGIRPNQMDSTYSPLISTPPFPGYPSGHAAGAATTCAVLEYFFPCRCRGIPSDGEGLCRFKILCRHTFPDRQRGRHKDGRSPGKVCGGEMDEK